MFDTQPQVMGILNVTPDSFSDGGVNFHVTNAIQNALLMEKEGADWIDIGGESTRPGAEPVSVEQECERVIPVIEGLRARSDVKISIDTSKPLVMEKAVAAGANMINDVYALQKEGALDAAAASGVPVCLMHMQGTPQTMQDNPEYRDVVENVSTFLIERAEACTSAGISRTDIVLDPGFGFGKTLEHNFQLLAQLDKLKPLGFPILVGLSRKSMIGAVTNTEIDGRLAGSLGAAMLALRHGANILRVHDVKSTVEVKQVFEACQTALLNS